jgi:hypothetical protein
MIEQDDLLDVVNLSSMTNGTWYLLSWRPISM